MDLGCLVCTANLCPTDGPSFTCWGSSWTLSSQRFVKRLSQENVRTLIKKKIKLSSYIRKFRMEQLQSHIWLTASSYMGKYLCISSYIRKPFLIYDFATAQLWISLNVRRILRSFYQWTIIQTVLFCEYFGGLLNLWLNHSGGICL